MGDILKGRVVIVTGAGRGIGRALALRCAREGARVVVAEIDGDTGATTAADIERRGGAALAVSTDVADGRSVAAMVEATIERFDRVDVLVNNAGLIPTVARRSFDEIPEVEWDRLMTVNVKGSWLCCKAVVPHMRRQEYGKIVNISSNTVLWGSPGLLHYVSSKGAIVAFTRSLARELGPSGIRVNTVAPGFTETEGSHHEASEVTARNVSVRAIPRVQRPEDLTGTVVFLASADSDFLTGQLIAVNGGSHMH
jgi:3-oxoacyl-[acyl-carrier protein] reductase